MAGDDELLRELGHALAPAATEPSPDRIARLRSLAGDGRSARERRGRYTLRSFAVAVAAGVLLGVAGGLLSARIERSAETAELAVEYDGALTDPAQVDRGDLTVIRTGAGRVIDIDTGHLPVLPPGRYYEVWFVGPGDTPDRPDRISAGTFHPDGNGRSSVRLTAAVDPARYPDVTVTEEPGDGDPAPGGPPLLRTRLR